MIYRGRYTCIHAIRPTSVYVSVNTLSLFYLYKYLLHSDIAKIMLSINLPSRKKKYDVLSAVLNKIAHLHIIIPIDRYSEHM
jgi:hypothetical protein